MNTQQEMILNTKQTKLLEFAEMKHGDQKRKYTGEPYINHPISVARKVYHLGFPYIEASICHDLIEDTDCDRSTINDFMVSIGYTKGQANCVTLIVTELTDVYTTEEFPHINRSSRKELERRRLEACTSVAQTIKYADIIDNCESIKKHDSRFYEVYYEECLALLDCMDRGDSNIRGEAFMTFSLAPSKAQS